MSAKLRPCALISKWLPGGPEACEARLAWVSRTAVGCIDQVVPFCTFLNTRAFGSRRPKGLTPLNTNSARPSQKLRRLKTALMTVGVLRGSTRRVLIPAMRKSGSATSARCSVVEAYQVA